jgi:hypothetical protein
LLCHHGHYFDRRIAPFAGKFAKENKDNKDRIERVEEASFAWLETLFYAGSIGRMSRGVFSKAYGYYQFADYLLGLKWIPMASGSRGRKDGTIGGLSYADIKQMIFNLFECEAYVLAFGHTHVKDHVGMDAGTIEMYNTGGWTVDDQESSARLPDTGFLYIGDDGAVSWESVEVERDEIEEVRARARNISAIG